MAFKIDDNEQWLGASCKIKYLFELMRDLKREGHRLLVFSKTKILLNMIEDIVSLLLG